MVTVKLCIEDPTAIDMQCIMGASDHVFFRVEVQATNGTAVGGHAGKIYTLEGHLGKGKLQLSARLQGCLKQLLQSLPAEPPRSSHSLSLRW